MSVVLFKNGRSWSRPPELPRTGAYQACSSLVLHAPDDATPADFLPTYDSRLSNHSQRIIHDIQCAIERGILETSGGWMRTTFPPCPPTPISTPASRAKRRIGRFLGGRLLRRPVSDQLDADHQTETPHLPDQR